MKFEGLSEINAKSLLKKYGKNEIKKGKKVSPSKLLLSQFTSPIILLLIAAAIISFFVNFFKHDPFFDSILIIIIIFAAGIAGFIQDFKAEKAVEALQEMATPKAKVIRNKIERIISSADIVPGDFIVVEEGDLVPADAEILTGKLEVNESILTGESRANKKGIKEKIFSGSAVYSGKVIARVFATGMKTEVGKIASKMEEIEEEDTPFQTHMKKFTKKIILLTIFIIIITFAIGFKKYGLLESGLIAVSLAVAAIPEDLPAVITIALSLGARAMVKKNALIRRLAITESIGSADVICTDKTGTLTKGKMSVRNMWFLDKNSNSEKLAKECCYYCNDSKVIVEGKTKKWIGDETEIALKQFSSSIKHDGMRLNEVPFTSERKLMSVLYKIKNGKKNKTVIFSKGAPEILIKKCTNIILDKNSKKKSKLTPKLKRQILEKNKFFASKGFRVLALAYKECNKSKCNTIVEKDFSFLGLVILSDPPRPETKKAVSECYSAGMRIIMITGDNPLTAKAIAEEIGIKTKGVLLGQDLDKLNDRKLEAMLKKDINIFARTTPFHKLKILKLLQKAGHVVAMTGDGVNDSLAIKKSDVGISMGLKGTEVSKEASDIILLDDNFETIKNAIKEGRRIFDNIRKFIDYLLTCNVAEVVVVLLATIFFPFISLFPVQILWINLITDGLPALALSMDPARPDVMKRKPRKKTEGIINKKLALLIGGIGIKKSLVILGTFLIVLPRGIDKARTVLFTGFIMYEFVRIGVIRYNEKLNSLKDWFSNKILVYSLLISLLLQLIIIYTPLSTYFKVVPLGIFEWVVLIGGTALGFILGIGIAWIVDKITHESY